MSDSKSAAGGGVGFGGLLTILFIALKLTGVIGWSWWWVLAPSWIPVAIVVGFGLLALTAALAIKVADGHATSKRVARRRAEIRAQHIRATKQWRAIIDPTKGFDKSREH